MTETPSLIEANLVIVTGCLPAMRLFFRHVAPRLIGESSLHSRKQMYGYAGGSHGARSELRATGSKHVKNVYDRVDDDGVSIGSDEERAAAGWHADAVSERGIVPSEGKGRITKTQSFMVESEVRVDDEGERGRVSACSVHVG